jgi:hypothetical protein
LADSSCCGGDDRERVEEEEEEEEEAEVRAEEGSWQPPGNPAAAFVWPAKAKPAATIRLSSSAAWKWTAA